MKFQAIVKYAFAGVFLISVVCAMPQDVAQDPDQVTPALDARVEPQNDPYYPHPKGGYYGHGTWRCFYQYRESGPVHKGVGESQKEAMRNSQKSCFAEHKVDLEGCNPVSDCVFK